MVSSTRISSIPYPAHIQNGDETCDFAKKHTWCNEIWYKLMFLNNSLTACYGKNCPWSSVIDLFDLLQVLWLSMIIVFSCIAMFNPCLRQPLNRDPFPQVHCFCCLLHGPSPRISKQQLSGPGIPFSCYSVPFKPFFLNQIHCLTLYFLAAQPWRILSFVGEMPVFVN